MANSRGSTTRAYRSYSMEMYTEYIADNGVFTTSPTATFPGGKCMIGGLTPWERSRVGNADASTQEFGSEDTMRKLGVSEGARVEVGLSNDVIPKVYRVV